jgi:hypothetical protein
MILIFKLRYRAALQFWAICLVMGLCMHGGLSAQEVTGDQEIRWVSIGQLWNWFSNAGAEVEYGRRGRTCCQEEDQADQLYWEAEYTWADRCVSKSMWIGTTNFDDPVSGEFYPYKVVPAGPRFANNNKNFLPITMDPYSEGADHYGIYSIGRFMHPTVMVDDIPATNLDDFDLFDYLDPTIPADRIVVNKLHSNMGVTVTRKIYAFSHQDHDNYYIYEYTFKNTGVYSLNASPHEKTLTGFIPLFHYRYAPGHQGVMYGWGVASTRWGTSTVNQVVRDDPTTPEVDLTRATYAWYHPHSQSDLGLEGDWGQPNGEAPAGLGASCFMGSVLLHADKSPDDKSDDLDQPYSAPWVDSDALMLSLTDSYDSDDMTVKYLSMSSGIPDPTHADLIGMNRFGDEIMEGIGGNSTSMGFGPYTLEPGDSVQIILSEAVAGLKRPMSLEVGYNWFYDNSPFVLPDETETSDKDEYKKAWVWTAEDSLFKAFRLAKEMWESGMYEGIQEPPRPPDQFTVTSGSNMISLSWEMSQETLDASPNLAGFRISRAVGRPDTLYEVVHTCDANTRNWDDTSPIRGFDYYYYIQSYSDGSDNDGVSSYSNKFWTMTNKAAKLQRPPIPETPAAPNVNDYAWKALSSKGDWISGSDYSEYDAVSYNNLAYVCIVTHTGDTVTTTPNINMTNWRLTTDKEEWVSGAGYKPYDVVSYNGLTYLCIANIPEGMGMDLIRIVPNPWDIRSRQLQFGTEPILVDRIAFYGLPPVCTIKIFTERGDLIKIIEHTNGSGDDFWHQETESRQIVVSGLYIAYFETPDGRSTFRKFIIIR